MLTETPGQAGWGVVNKYEAECEKVGRRPGLKTLNDAGHMLLRDSCLQQALRIIS